MLFLRSSRGALALTVVALGGFLAPHVADASARRELARTFLTDDLAHLPPTDFDRLRWDARMSARLLRLPGKRPPTAEEVGPFTDGAQLDSFTPLPGLPLDTSWDSVGWTPQGMAPAHLGDLNIAPDHPSAGAISAVVPHPLNQNIVYVGAANGGVWRTDNALAANPRWKPLTDDQLSLSIGGLTLDPTDSSHETLVAGFGRRSSLANLGGAHRGLLRTTNGGVNWTRIGETALAGRSVKDIAARGNTILVGVPRTDNGTLPGLYRTTDGGVNFTNVSGGAGTGLPAGGLAFLASDPTNSTRFYAHVAGVGLFRSTNSGANWTNISAGYSAAGTAIVALAVGNDGTLFAAECAGTSRVARSTNQGGTWTALDSVVVNMSEIFHGIAVDRSNSNLVYLSGLLTRANFPFSGRIVRGNAAAALGSQWTAIASEGDTGMGTAPHTDSRSLAITAGGRLLEGSDGGIYELNIPNVGSQGNGVGGGGMWRSLNSNLQTAEMHSVSYDPVARIFFGGTQDNSYVTQVKSGERLWNATTTGDGGVTANDRLFSPGQSLRYGSVQYHIGFSRRTYNASNTLIGLAFPTRTLVGGGTPIDASDTGNMPFYTPNVTNAVAGGRLIISGNNVLYESTDRGSTVRQIATFGVSQTAAIAYGGRLTGIDVPDVLLCGSGATLFCRTVAGGTFTQTNIPGGVGTVQAVAFDPTNWRSAYVVATSAVYAADLGLNGSAGLTNITGNLTGVGTFHTVTYLTLPSGNCLALGTDLGVFIMRVAAPGVWQALGDNLPRAPVFAADFDAAGQVLGVSTLGRGAWLFDFKQTKATGVYAETFSAFVAGVSTLPARVGELFSNQLGTVAMVADNDTRELALTADGVQGTRTVFRLPDLNPGRPVTGFSAKWNAQIFGDASALADGFSFTFGPLATTPGTVLTNTFFNQEDGFNSGLTVGVRTFSGNNPGYTVKTGFQVVPGGFVSKPSSAWGNFNETRHFFEVDWTMASGLTLRVDGVPIFTNLPTPGFVPSAGDVFVFAARTGGFFQETRLDNIVIFTGGTLVPVAVSAPYHFSTETAGGAAALAFDGNPATAWRSSAIAATGFSGFIGASIPAGANIRAYTVTGLDSTSRRSDPRSWDFQVGTDGTLWTQHGIQTASAFRRPAESRTYVVAEPRVSTAFRLLVSENNEDTDISVAELRPWAFEAAPAAFTVTSNATSGVGSLRQALADAAAFQTSATIRFDPALSGQTIALSDGPLVFSNPNSVTVDALALPRGLTLNANGLSRVVELNPGSRANLRGLTLTGGNGISGGGIFNDNGRLLVEQCTISGNSATNGGGVYSTTNSDFVTSRTELRVCTLALNGASQTGAGFYNFNGASFLIHCTISANEAAPGNGSGVASYGDAVTFTDLNATIVAQNFNSDVDFVISASNNSFNSSSYNLVGTGNALGDFTGPGDMTNADALLAPLDDYGGRGRTMALRPGSPARDAAFGIQATFVDQRGFPFIGTSDIGAYEAGHLAQNYNAYIWETLPLSATNADRVGSFDFDRDGRTNFEEWLAVTNAADSSSVFRVASFVFDNQIPGYRVSVQTVVGRNYIIEGSFDLQTWFTFNTFAGTGGIVSRTYSPSDQKVIYRVRVSQ